MNQERRNKIVERLEKQGTITNGELMETFGISIETVRRDLADLEKRGLLERVYGGAVKRRYMKVEPNYFQREQNNAEAKNAIAQTAQKFIEKDSAVYFDLGTTVLAVAQRLECHVNAFTNALRTATVLAERGVNVFVSGGNLRNGEFSVSGSISENNMQRFNIDVALIGVGGITEEGISDYIDSEATLRRQIVQNAKKVVALADYTKFGVRAMCNVCSVEEIDVLITDEKTPKEILRVFEKKGVQVVVAK